MFTSVRGSFGKCRLAKQKTQALHGCADLRLKPAFFILPQAKSPRRVYRESEYGMIQKG
jgi:hypothetical protein